MSEMKEFEEKMGKSVDALQEDYATIRAGRANPHILDNITEHRHPYSRLPTFPYRKPE